MKVVLISQIFQRVSGSCSGPHYVHRAHFGKQFSKQPVSKFIIFPIVQMRKPRQRAFTWLTLGPDCKGRRWNSNWGNLPNPCPNLHFNKSNIIFSCQLYLTYAICLYCSFLSQLLSYPCFHSTILPGSLYPALQFHSPVSIYSQAGFP